MKKIAKSWRPHISQVVAAARRFEELVAAALDDLPAEIRERMENVEVVVEDGPAPPDLLGLYHGIPLTERAGYAGVLPDVITIYRRAIEARAPTGADLEAEVRATVWHEIAHHFGISDDRLRELGRH